MRIEQPSRARSSFYPGRTCKWVRSSDYIGRIWTDVTYMAISEGIATPPQPACLQGLSNLAAFNACERTRTRVKRRGSRLCAKSAYITNLEPGPCSVTQVQLLHANGSHALQEEHQRELPPADAVPDGLFIVLDSKDFQLVDQFSVGHPLPSELSLEQLLGLGLPLLLNRGLRPHLHIGINASSLHLMHFYRQ